MLSIGIAVVALIAVTIKSDFDVWKCVNRGDYLVVFALPKILLGVQSFSG